MSGSPDRRRPTKRDLKATILWCSRWLLGEGEQPYSGKHLTVCLTAAGQGEAIEVKPVRGTDGIELPALVRAPEVAAVAGVVEGSELLRVLFSTDERSILRALAHKEPSKANDVLDRCRSEVEKSKFWVLWSNLQHRFVVGDAEVGDGFQILPVWVREMMLAEIGKGRGAA